ncbi:hypothetical protein [Synechococcus sp. UW140]|uniref:hypothetical protein n=1 Tax=Synechococcus sp. UW140 TaxID=368503 RepID=UPI003138460E
MQFDLSVEVAKVVVLLLIFVVTGTAIILTRALNDLIRPISRQLIEMHKGNTGGLEPKLGHIRHRYISLLSHVDNIDTAEFSAGEIERLSLRIFGREVTAASAHSWIHQAPGILISLGLLGTFWGLTVGLSQISGALAPGATPDQTMKTLSAIVAPMGTAFQTSLIGLLFSLIVLITSQLSGARTCLERCESLLSSWLETVLPQELGDKLMTPLKKSIDGLNETSKQLPSVISLSVEQGMNAAFAEKLATMFNLNSTIAVEAQNATRQMAAVASNLNESGQDFVMAARVFQQSNFPEALRESVLGLLETKERITDSSESLSARMQEMRDALLVMNSQWQFLAKSAETELETCRLATQQMHQGLTQLQNSSQSLDAGVEITGIAAKQLKETRLEIMRDRKISIEISEAVRDRLAVDSSATESCQVFAEALATALNKWNTSVEQLDSLRQQFIQIAINDRNDDQVKVEELAQKTQGLISSINGSLSNDLNNAIIFQREALGQLGAPMSKAQQLTVDLIEQLEALKARMDQQYAEQNNQLLLGQRGET